MVEVPNIAKCLSILPLLAFASITAAQQSGDGLEDGNFGGPSYAVINQINTSNVQRLKTSWVYHTHNNFKNVPMECRPIVEEGLMYLVTQTGRVVALNPATGKEVWSFDSKKDESRSVHQKASRGVAFWSDHKANGGRRILYGTPDGRILSIDAKTGLADPKFKPVDLRAQLGPRWKNEAVGVTAAPTIYKDFVYVGLATGEDAGSAPGHIMAFHIPTGRRVWTFHVIPQEGEFGTETWKNRAWKNGYSAGAWNGYTIDTDRGVLFAATGSAAPDFDGRGRLGDNLFADCVIALDAATGERLWHFQTVHHDLWDHDNASAPTLCRVKRNGKYIKAIAEVTKTGFCFVLDRVTGKPLFDVREVPAAPASDPAEQASPTQPEPVLPPPLSDNVFTLDKVTDLSPESHALVTSRLKKLAYGLKYLPPTANGTVVVPGYFGGSPWSGASFDPHTDTLFVNTNNIPAIMANPANYSLLTDQDGYPGIKPPWGNLTAINLDTGKFKWRRTLGEYPELIAKHIPQTGIMNLGGTLATSGNLLFVGATADSMFRAFDSRTGKLLWETKLPASAYAAPATYRVGTKQYVVIAACGGGFGKAFGMDHGPLSDAVVCFSLPDSPPPPKPRAPIKRATKQTAAKPQPRVQVAKKKLKI